MKILVIGSNGYLGRHIVKSAREAGWPVQTSDIQESAWDHDPGYIRCDVREKQDLQRLNWQVDAVFLFTGLSGTTAGFGQYADYIDINEKGLVGVLECVRSVKPAAPRIIFPSSRLVYRGVKGVPLKEDAEPDSLTMYAVNKRAAEMYLEMYRKIFGVHYTVFRICVPYANMFDQSYSYGTTGFFLRFAQEGKDIPIYGDGSQRRTFSHVDDLCRQVMMAVENPESDGRIFNVAGGDDLSIAEAAGLVAAHYGVKLTHVDWPELDRLCETGDTIFDSSAIRKLTGYKCQHMFNGWVGTLPRRKAADLS